MYSTVLYCTSDDKCSPQSCCHERWRIVFFSAAHANPSTESSGQKISEAYPQPSSSTPGQALCGTRVIASNHRADLLFESPRAACKQIHKRHHGTWYPQSQERGLDWSGGIVTLFRRACISLPGRDEKWLICSLYLLVYHPYRCGWLAHEGHHGHQGVS
jgi:hypothetical protein